MEKDTGAHGPQSAARRIAEAAEQTRYHAAITLQEKKHFLTNMSHAIRTPLNGVIGMAELLAQSELDARQKTFVDIIVKSGDALQILISNVLDFVRIDAGAAILKPATFSLMAAIEDEIALIISRIREKNLELIVRIQPGLHDYYIGDIARFRQILGNLLGNAASFTDSGHVRVDISGETQGEDVALLIAITDTGIGISPDRLALVFDRFNHPAPPAKRKHEGMGLGLAIALRLATLMGGTIRAESQKDKGSTFIVSLHLPRAESMQEPHAIPVEISGARILIVDDNAVSRTMLMELMKYWDADACAADSGEEGLAVLNAMAALGLQPDCLIIDAQMPEMSGVQMARIIHKTRNIAHAPIIMLTTTEDSANQTDYDEPGISHLLDKPARPAALLEAVIAAIRQGRDSNTAGRSISGRTGTRRGSRRTGAGIAAQNLHLAADADSETNRIDVLVAEDNEVNQLVFAQILSQTGLTYQIVANGLLAVQAFQAIRPRMVLMDMTMPQMNGLEATARIRAAEAGTGQRTPVIGVCSHAPKSDPDHFIATGMDDYLTKPVSPQMLMQKIEHWLDGTDASRSRHSIG